MWIFNKVLSFYKKLCEFICDLVWPKKDSHIAKYPPLCIKQGNVAYLVNDPSYPNLYVNILNPSPDRLKLNVKFYIGATEGFESPQGKAANVYGLLCHGINIFQPKTNLSRWCAVDVLNVDPLAGRQANAFYDRENLKFFYFTKQQNEIFTCLSSDIVSHELGHAILDAMRPDFFSVASMEIWSFHEAFGDVASMICTLKHELIVDYVLKETNGNLRQKNIVSKLAEEMGKNLGYSAALRDSCNDFVYVNPSSLPKIVSGDGLANEPHSFARIMSGVFYDVMVEIYEKLGKTASSLQHATDYILDSLVETSKVAPASANFYETFCQTWLKLDVAKAVSYQDILKKVFDRRNIFRVTMLSDQTLPKENLSKEKVEIYMDNDLKVEKCVLSMSVSEIIPENISAMNDSEFGNLKVQLAVDEMYINEESGMVRNLCFDVSGAVEAAKELLSYIMENNLFGDEEDKVWTKDNKNNLVRKHFSCDCFINNSTIPGNPEYGKGYKQQNNSGCCTYGSCANSQQTPVNQIEKSCNLRYHSSCSSVNYNGKC